MKSTVFKFRNASIITKPPFCNSFLRAGSFASVVFLAFSQSAAAQTSTWSGGGGNTNWSTAGNWSSVPVAGANERITFAGTTNVGTSGSPLVNDITGITASGTPTLPGLDFPVGAGSFFLSGNSITTAWIANSSGSRQTLGMDIANNGSELVFSTTNGTPGAADIVMNGVISGAGGLRKLVTSNNQASLVLNGANTYTGKTIIQAGSITINSIKNVGAGASSLGAPATVPNGTIDLAVSVNDSRLIYTGTGDTTDRVINAGNNARLVQSGTGSLMFTSNFTATIATINSLITLDGSSAGTGEIAGIIGNPSGLTTRITKEGSGTWTLSGTNTYTGGTTITAGTLQLGSGGTTGALTGTNTIANNANLTVNRSNAFTQVTDLNGKAITGSGSFTQAGTGTTTLTSANTYTGGTTVNGGTLALESAGALGSSGTISFGGGTLQHSANNATDYSSRFSTAASQQYSIDTNSQSVTLASNLTSDGGSFTKLGTGTLTLTGANTYSGATTVTAGQLTVNGSSSGSAHTIGNGATLGGSGTVGALVVENSATLAPGNSPGVLTVAGTTTLNTGSMFEWELDTAAINSPTRGVAYDGLNTSALTGTGAIFKIMLTGTQDFADAFWNQTRTWTDIFKTANDGTTLSDWASVFGGGFQYSYNGQTVAPTSQGYFTTTGSSLTWSAVPEPSNLLAGMLAASALLRRRRMA